MMAVRRIGGKVKETSEEKKGGLTEAYTGGYFIPGQQVYRIDGRKGVVISVQGGLAEVKWDDGEERIEPTRHLTCSDEEVGVSLPEDVETQSSSLSVQPGGKPVEQPEKLDEDVPEEGGESSPAKNPDEEQDAYDRTDERITEFLSDGMDRGESPSQAISWVVRNVKGVDRKRVVALCKKLLLSGLEGEEE